MPGTKVRLAGCLVIVMALTVAAFHGAGVYEENRKLARSVFVDCGTQWWTESLYRSIAAEVAMEAPLDTHRWPLEGTSYFLYRQFFSESRYAEVLSELEKHFDRERFERLQAWCNSRPAETRSQELLPAPMLKTVFRAARFSEPRDHRWQLASRLAHAQHAPKLAEDIAAIWIDAFAGGLKEGLAPVRGNATSERLLAEVGQSPAMRKKDVAGFDDVMTTFYLGFLKGIPDQTLASSAVFWESDLGQWYASFQWEAEKRFLIHTSRAAGLAMAGLAVREMLGQPRPAEQSTVPTWRETSPRTEDYEEVLRSAYSNCGLRSMVYDLYWMPPPVSTKSGPFAHLEDLFEESLVSVANDEAALTWLRKHADRERMRAFQKWCATDAARRVESFWPPPPLRISGDLSSLKDPPSERCRKALDRLIAARRVADFYSEASPAVTLPFFEELRKGLTSAGIDASKVSALAVDPIEKPSALRLSRYYLLRSDYTNEDLEAAAAFWESDLGRWFTTLQWDEVKALLEAIGRKGGKALAEAGAKHWDEKVPGRGIK